MVTAVLYFLLASSANTPLQVHEAIASASASARQGAKYLHEWSFLVALGATYGTTHTCADRCKNFGLTGQCKDPRLTGIAACEAYEERSVRRHTLNCTLAAAALSGFLAPQ